MSSRAAASQLPRTAKRPSRKSATLSTVVQELQGLRRDMVVLCRVIVEGQKGQRKSLEQSLKRAEQPGSLSANVQMPSWYDAIFEADKEQAEG